MSIESEAGFGMRIAGNRRLWQVRRFLDRYDLAYAVPVAIAVAAFVFAVLAYFGAL